MYQECMTSAIDPNAKPSHIVQLCEALLPLAIGFLHPYHRMLVQVYATRSFYETVNADVALDYLQRHMTAVKAILGACQPPVIDDLVYIGLISKKAGSETEYKRCFAEAEALHVELFGSDGRAFAQHAQGLSVSVSAPHLGRWAF